MGIDSKKRKPFRPDYKKKKSKAGKPKLSNDPKVNAEDKSKTSRPPGKLQKMKALIPKGMTLSRKELRKEIRSMKKARRNAYNNKTDMPTLKQKLANDQKVKDDAIERQKKLNQKREKKREKEKRRLEKRAERDKAEEEARLAKEEEEEERRLAEEAEEAEIKFLEKQLYMTGKRKSKGLPKKFVEEGLDYILDCIDSEKVKEMNPEDDVWNISESDEDDQEKPKKKRKTLEIQADGENEKKDMNVTKSSSEESGVDEVDSDEMSSAEHEESGGESGENSEDEYDDGLDADSEEEDSDTRRTDDGTIGSDQGGMQSAEDAGSEEEEEAGDGSENGNRSEDGGDKGTQGYDDNDREGMESDEDETGANLKEDIYGRLRDKDGNVIQAYVPPAKRRQLEGNDEARRIRLERLSKQLKGQLNRVSESNMLSICNLIEGKYREYSRADINETLYRLISDAVLSEIITPERLNMEMAMLVALLHNNIGTEIGATFLEHLANTFNSLHSSTEETTENKQLDNIIGFLCHLYNFQVTQSLLITDLFYMMIDSFKNKDIELILIMLKHVGFTLRKDKPTILKDIILKTQRKSNQVDTSTYKDPSRVKFMLDILLAVKNNNMRKIPNYDPEHLEHLRKLLRGYTKASSLAGNQLSISYKDLLEASTKGKWWVVGSAWQGSETISKAAKQSTYDEPKFTTKLLELARKQRMNTETRRNIFCTILSSEDYIDAFERLLRLGLKGAQEYEIITVILECSCNEKMYNAFYTHLLTKFTTYHRRFVFTYQTQLWDKFKAMQGQSSHAISNLASMTGHMITQGVVSLAILKAIEFGELNKYLVKFIKSLLECLFKENDTKIQDIFYKVGTAGNKLASLKEGLELFMHHFMLRKCKNTEKETLMKKVEVAEDALNLRLGSQ